VAGRLVAANLSSGSNGDEGGTGIVAHSPELPFRRNPSACTVPRVSYVGTPSAVRLPEVTRMCDESHESVGPAGGARGRAATNVTRRCSSRRCRANPKVLDAPKRVT
jgi:hypothetical protein